MRVLFLDLYHAIFRQETEAMWAKPYPKGPNSTSSKTNTKVLLDDAGIKRIVGRRVSFDRITRGEINIIRTGEPNRLPYVSTTSSPDQKKLINAKLSNLPVVIKGHNVFGIDNDLAHPREEYCKTNLSDSDDISNINMSPVGNVVPPAREDFPTNISDEIARAAAKGELGTDPDYLKLGRSRRDLTPLNDNNNNLENLIQHEAVLEARPRNRSCVRKFFKMLCCCFKGND